MLVRFSDQDSENNDFGNLLVLNNNLTPGFWCNHEEAWDGDQGNGYPHKVDTDTEIKDLRELDILNEVDADGDGDLDGFAGVLLGDLNQNGYTDEGKTTIFIDLECAMELKLYPGLPVEAVIIPCERTAIDYLIGPITDTIARSLRES